MRPNVPAEQPPAPATRPDPVRTNPATASAAQTEAPGTGFAQGGSPQSGTFRPGADQPGTAQSGTGQFGTGQFGTGQFGTGQFGAGQPGAVKPAAGQPGTGQPGTGQPDTIQPGGGQPADGQPGGSAQFGNAEFGEPNAGRPGTGQAGAENPEAARPGTGGADADPAGQGDGQGVAQDIESEDFQPANDAEQNLLNAVEDGSTDAFLSTLLLATVLVPVAHNSRPGSAPGESGFAFRTEELDGDRFLVVFTSRDRLAEHFAEPTRTVTVRFVDLIRNWPDPAWSFAVNPTSPIGAKYPGPQVIALANWATEAGLGREPADTPLAIEAPAALPQRSSQPSGHQTAMQKAIPAEQVDYYLERGYDRVAGFVHRAAEVEHLRTPGELFAALGLLYDGSPYPPDAKEAFVLRWPAYRPSLYRIPYGGQSEQALRAMDGWVIERPPFRGNGFAPGEGKDVIAEFKVDSVRLPHGAELWRMDADGDERMIAIFDCDAPVWRRVGEPDA